MDSAPVVYLDKLRSFLRILTAIYAQIQERGLDYRAMSLVYTTLLSLIPLLAVSFAMLKAFKADAYLQPMILEMLKPLGGNNQAVTDHLIESVRNLDVSVLGSVGLLSLLYTSVSLLDKIEESFNHIFRVRNKSNRNILRRFSDYLSVILVGPLLVFTGFGGLNELVNRAEQYRWLGSWLGLLISLFQTLLPFLLVIAAFALIYRIIPDAVVAWQSAWFGGVMAGLLWKLVGWVFAVFMAGSAQYHLVYSTFAILILFMVWLYMSWMIVLLGLQVVFFHQHPRYLDLLDGHSRLSGRLTERLGFLVMVLVARRFLKGEPPWHTHELAERLEVPDDWLAELIAVLTAKGFLMATGEKGQGISPARSITRITVEELLQALRRAREENFPVDERALAEPVVDSLLAHYDQALLAVSADRTLLDLIEQG